MKEKKSRDPRTQNCPKNKCNCKNTRMNKPNYVENNKLC